MAQLETILTDLVLTKGKLYSLQTLSFHMSGLKSSAVSTKEVLKWIGFFRKDSSLLESELVGVSRLRVLG